jgi:hypothetical protein
MVLGIAMLLVVGIAKLLGGSSDGSGNDSAAPVADTSSLGLPASTASDATNGPSGDASTTQSTTPSTGRGTHQGKKNGADDPVSHAVMPSGPCAPSDVAITPSVPRPVAGGDISLVFDVSSIDTPACTWTMSGGSMALKITSGKDLIWTTTDCPKAVARQDLVLRQSDPTRVRITWDARRSAPGCPVQTEWALPGTYHLHVAALAGQPQDVTFLLTAPSPAQVTRTAHPHQGTHHAKKKHQKPPPG